MLFKLYVYYYLSLLPIKYIEEPKSRELKTIASTFVEFSDRTQCQTDTSSVGTIYYKYSGHSGTSVTESNNLNVTNSIFGLNIDLVSHQYHNGSKLTYNVTNYTTLDLKK